MRKPVKIIEDEFDELEQEYEDINKRTYGSRTGRHRLDISHLYLNEELADTMSELLEIYKGLKPTDIVRIALIRLLEEEEDRLVKKVQDNPSIIKRLNQNKEQQNGDSVS